MNHAYENSDIKMIKLPLNVGAVLVSMKTNKM